MEVLGVSPITQEEYANLNPKSGSVPRIRESHHRMAELHAASLTPAQISELTGRSLTHVRNFPKVPANAELISQKVVEACARAEDFLADPVAYHTRQLIALRVKAVDMLNDRLDEAAETGEKIPVRTLLSIAGDMADRTGFGRQATQVNINVGIAAQLEERMRRAGSQMDRRAKTIEHIPDEVKSLP